MGAGAGRDFTSLVFDALASAFGFAVVKLEKKESTSIISSLGLAHR